MEYENQMQPPHPPANGFATASLVLGILALVSVFTFTVIPPFFFGSLSIIFGILSKHSSRKMSSKALTGTITSSCAFVANIAVCIVSFFVVFSNPQATQEYWNTVNEMYEQMTGMSMEEILESYGIDPGLIQK